MSPTLVLWDIDLTLIRVSAIGRELYGAAFEQLTGRKMAQQGEAAGRRDPDIWADTLRLNGFRGDAFSFSEFCDCLAKAYESAADQLRLRGELLPGAVEALTALSNRAGTVQTILTGNIEKVATVKLASFGLNQYLDLDIATYGSDGDSRAQLVEIARGRAATKYHASFEGVATVVIGDSHHDVHAAQEARARAVAVASGRTPFEQLRDLGPEHLFRDLSDTPAVVSAVLNGTEIVSNETDGYRATGS